MRKYDYYWTTNNTWYYFDENGVRHLRDDAPPEAKKSYERYLDQRARTAKEIEKTGCLD